MFTVLTFEGPYRDAPKTRVLRRGKAIASALGISSRDVCVTLTTDKHIHELNKTFRKKNKPTDVLAFAMQEGEFAEHSRGALGDVIISVHTARKQADEEKRSVLDEVTMLMAHGILHLLGWDHETAQKDRKMRQEVARLCALAERSDLHGGIHKQKPRKY